MELTIHEAQLKVVNIIRDVLLELAIDGDVQDDLEEMSDHFGRVAELIVDQLGLVVEEGDGGGVKATLVPARGWL